MRGGDIDQRALRPLVQTMGMCDGQIWMEAYALRQPGTTVRGGQCAGGAIGSQAEYLLKSARWPL